MKKLLVVLGLCVFALTGCDSDSDSGEKDKSNNKYKTYTESTAATTRELHVELDTPNAYAELDGEVLFFCWDTVENATSYELDYNGQIWQGTEDWVYLSDVVQGQQYTAKVRAVCDIEGKTFYSDWKEVQYEVPVLDYANLREASMVFFSENQLLEWANTQGYKYEIEETQGNTIVKVHYADELNSGFFNSAGRVLSSALDGFFGGYSETIEDDFSSVENILYGYLTSDGVKDYLSGEDEAATENGKKSAVFAALNAAFLDTDIYYIATYSNTELGPDYVLAYKLKNGRSNVIQANDEAYSKDSQGRYIINSSVFNKNIYMEITDIVSDGFQKWAYIFTTY